MSQVAFFARKQTPCAARPDQKLLQGRAVGEIQPTIEPQRVGVHPFPAKPKVLALVLSEDLSLTRCM